MKWLFAIAGALLIQGALLLFLLGMKLPSVSLNPKAAQGTPVVFREMKGNSAKAAVTPPVEAKKQVAARKAGPTVIAAVSKEVGFDVAPVKAEQAVVPDAGFEEQGSALEAVQGDEPATDGVGHGGGREGAESGSGDSGDGAKGASTTGGSDSAKAELAAYGTELLTRISAQQRVTLQMQRLRLKGTATVTLRIARDGSLMSAALAESAGHALLDGEALRMVNVAAPFRPLPKSWTEASAQFSVPIRFHSVSP